MTEIGYNDNLDPEEQLRARDWIAAKIFDCEDIDEQFKDGNPIPTIGLSEEACNNLGKTILLEILRRFRPDLVEDPSGLYLQRFNIKLRRSGAITGFVEARDLFEAYVLALAMQGYEVTEEDDG